MKHCFVSLKIFQCVKLSRVKTNVKSLSLLIHGIVLLIHKFMLIITTSFLKEIWRCLLPARIKSKLEWVSKFGLKMQLVIGSQFNDGARKDITYSKYWTWQLVIIWSGTSQGDSLLSKAANMVLYLSSTSHCNHRKVWWTGNITNKQESQMHIFFLF